MNVNLPTENDEVTSPNKAENLTSKQQMETLVKGVQKEANRDDKGLEKLTNKVTEALKTSFETHKDDLPKNLYLTIDALKDKTLSKKETKSLEDIRDMIIDDIYGGKDKAKEAV